MSKAYHKSCGSIDLVQKTVRDIRSRRDEIWYICQHGNKPVENDEIGHTDPRLSAVIFKGLPYHHGREVKK